MEMFEYDSRIGAVAEATIQRCPTCGHLLSAAQGPDALCIRCEPDREPASARHASRASTIPQPHLHPPVRTSTTPSSTSALFDSISSIASSRPPSFMDSASEAEPDTEELEDHAELQARIHELEALLQQAEQTLAPEEFAIFQNEKFSSISVITPSGEQLLSSSDSMSSDGDAYSDISPDEDKTMEMWSSEPLEQPSGLLFSVTPSAIPSLPAQSIQVPEARSLEDLHDPIIPKDDLSYEPPEEVVSHIIDTYCAHAAVFNFYKPVYLFRSQLQHARALGLSTSHPDAPHPLLMNTVYLLGTHFSHRRQSEYDAARDGALCFTRLEELFLARSMRLANEQSSIEGGDRALDFCMALCNLARFFMYTKRFDLGIQFTNSSMAFAVGCGLHQIDVRPMVASSPIFASHASSPLSPTPTLPPPRSEQDVINRIRLWHSVFIVRGSSRSLPLHSFWTICGVLFAR
ncbi:hypothetical protein DL93DRAFT_210375 [Clavulina sp. PMI_390]|nr:hypothetical protein DL93DRAFT_210375 [Clavulina sp. PMI_390]